MNRNLTLVVIILIVLASGTLLWFRGGQKSSLSNPGSFPAQKQIQPSETFIEYADPSGFTFSYPDNLSITTNEGNLPSDGSEVDEESYADLQLFSNEVSGSLSLKIADSKYKTIDEWASLNKGISKDVKLGSMDGKEIKTSDRLLFGALDQGIFFSIEMPLITELETEGLIEEDFWMKVYSKLLSDFSFELPEESVGATSSDISFEGEEVVE